MLLQILQLIVIIINELADRTLRDYVSLGAILRFVDREVRVHDKIPNLLPSDGGNADV